MSTILSSVQQATYPVYQLQVLVKKTDGDTSSVEPALSFYMSSVDVGEEGSQVFTDFLTEVKAWAKNYQWPTIGTDTVEFDSVKVLEAVSGGTENVEDISPTYLPYSTDVLWADTGSVVVPPGPNQIVNNGAETGPNNSSFVEILTNQSSSPGTFIMNGYNAAAAIGSEPASIDSVAVTVYWYMTGTGTVTVQLRNEWTNTLLGNPVTLTPSSSPTNHEEVVFTGVANWEDLGNLGVQVSCVSDTANTTRYLLDAVSVAVNYRAA